ncbi:hypothetical protein QQF64_004498 [Cirrhinus molitorella]|uniref:Gypsy retrotransposon integrase-like protein 1 n=1 Tax=Cirrhinus molitorella TaxID=172907 RepID=A0ABR3MGE3_9TELE
MSATGKLMSSCPYVEVVMGGVKVSCLLDTGSMVSTVTESFFLQHLKTDRLQACCWLHLRAANGLAIPYLGYLELDVSLCEKVIPGCGILVVKDPPGGASVPGVLGMNIISKCYELLFGQHGPALFELSTVSQVPGPVFQALQQYHQADGKPSLDLKSCVKLCQGRVQRIPEGVTKFVAATCSDQFSGGFALFEPLNPGLPGGLLASPALVRVVGGTVYIPVVNVGTTDIVLYACTWLGHLCSVDVISLPKGVAELSAIEAVGPSPKLILSQIDALDLSHIDSEDSQQIRGLLHRYQSVFSAHEGNLGCTNLISHELPLSDEVPVRQRYQWLPPSEYEVVKAHIDQLLEAWVIRESCSPYASPIVLVRKKNGSPRLCVDYRQLNQKTRKDAFPLPRIEESLDALSGACWFSTLDLASGYNQVPVAEKDRAKTAFCTPFGLFEFNRMPFGLCNAPSTFQRLMQRLFGKQHCQSFLLYLDDVVVFSSTVSQHLERLEGVLSRLEQEGLKAKLEKCAFLKQELGATEQRWVAQLACFDYEIRYRSGRINKNADALSRQYLPIVTTTPVPGPLQQAEALQRQPHVIQTAIFALPHHSASDMRSLQWADLDIRAVLTFWRQKKRPSSVMSQELSPPAVALLRHWDRLVERDGVLHRRTFRPNGGEEVFQVVLPASLKQDVLTQLHQDHGHQGVERTTELVRQRCFWPGMTAEVKSWCQECERCQVAKDNKLAASSLWGIC